MLLSSIHERGTYICLYALQIHPFSVLGSHANSLERVGSSIVSNDATSCEFIINDSFSVRQWLKANIIKVDDHIATSIMLS